MNLQTIAWVFAVVFVGVGVLGFVPGVTTADGLLLGIFQVDALHNIVHIASGLAAAAAVMISAAYTRLYFQVFGVVYAVVTVVGFAQGDTVLGLISVNMADHILHLVIAAALLYLGFGTKDSGEHHEPQAPSAPSAPEQQTPMQPGGQI